MMGYYRLSGVLAVAALGLYILFTIGGLAMIGATLTLPGVAGIVLSIGIAVDANVLIFERIREELARGKTVRLSIDEGFKHAMNAIIDSNVSTVLTALFLFQFGTGPVKGFAVTLTMGIIASMITAVFVTRTFFMIWLNRRPDHDHAEHLTMMRFFANANYDFIGFRRIRLRGHRGDPRPRASLSLVVTGSTTASSSPAAPWSRSRPPSRWMPARSAPALDAQGLKGAEIQSFGCAQEFVIRARLAATDANADNTQAAAGGGEPRARRRPGRRDLHGRCAPRRSAPRWAASSGRRPSWPSSYSFFAVLAYLAWRFEWRFGLAAVVATAHDILTTVAFIASCASR